MVDPHHLGAAAARLGGLARRAGKVPLAVVGALLGPGESVSVVVQGRFRAEPAVAALVEGSVGARVIVANGRRWKPDVVSLAIEGGLDVHGWQDDRSAALTFVAGERREVVERIGDRGLAVEMAERIRHAAGRPGEPAASAPGWSPPATSVPAPVTAAPNPPPVPATPAPPAAPPPPPPPPPAR